MKESKTTRKSLAKARKPEPAKKKTPLAPRPPVAKKAPPAPRPPVEEKALEEFAAALRLFQKGELAKARDQFKSILGKFPQQRELCDRARTYVQICERAVQPPSPCLKDLDDFYHQGVFFLNQRNAEEACRMFEKALAIDPASEKVHYALAAAHALAGRADSAIESLRKAIAASASNRMMAATDPDFESLRDHPGFLALVSIQGEDPA